MAVEQPLNTVSLRDQFAMAALQGLATRYVGEMDKAAEIAYIYADAMLKQRIKKLSKTRYGSKKE